VVNEASDRYAEDEVDAHTEVTVPDEADLTLDERFAAWRAERGVAYEALRGQARAAFAAMRGWEAVETEEEWLALCERTGEEYASGRFLIERLGAERFLDPSLMATLWRLRQTMLADLGADTAHEHMLVDLAVMSYHHLLRINSWIGDLALVIEREFFGQPSPTVLHERAYGRRPQLGRDRLNVEDQLRRLGEQLLPRSARPSK
jgi:hypothetical protein